MQADLRRQIEAGELDPEMRVTDLLDPDNKRDITVRELLERLEREQAVAREVADCAGGSAGGEGTS